MVQALPGALANKPSELPPNGPRGQVGEDGFSPDSGSRV